MKKAAKDILKIQQPFRVVSVEGMNPGTWRYFGPEDWKRFPNVEGFHNPLKHPPAILEFTWPNEDTHEFDECQIIADANIMCVNTPRQQLYRDYVFKDANAAPVANATKVWYEAITVLKLIDGAFGSGDFLNVQDAFYILRSFGFSYR